MQFVNSWKAIRKQSDKVNIELRISTLTLFKFYFDISNLECELILMNFGLKI